MCDMWEWSCDSVSLCKSQVTEACYMSPLFSLISHQLPVCYSSDVVLHTEKAELFNIRLFLAYPSEPQERVQRCVVEKKKTNQGYFEAMGLQKV